MSEVRVWVNGALVAADQPAIAAIDHGVTVGDGAFETCKIRSPALLAHEGSLVACHAVNKTQPETEAA